MANQYLKIKTDKNGEKTVINTIMAEPTDLFDPEFEWSMVEPKNIHPLPVFKKSLKIVDVITGKNDSFLSFNFSEASGGLEVSCEWPIITIGCKKYDIEYLRHELTLLHKHNRHRGDILYATKNGIIHENNCITWEDTDKLLSVLETLK